MHGLNVDFVPDVCCVDAATLSGVGARIAFSVRKEPSTSAVRFWRARWALMRQSGEQQRWSGSARRERLAAAEASDWPKPAHLCHPPPREALLGVPFRLSLLRRKPGWLKAGP